MTVRQGTCYFAWQPMEAAVPVPFEDGHRRPQVETLPEGLYYCNFLGHGEGPLPPPVVRMAAVFEIRPGDCEMCPYWHPADEGMLIRLWKKYRKGVVAKQKRIAKKSKAA